MAKTQKKSGISSAFKKRLKEANKHWASAKKTAEEQKGFGEFEDGKYMARLMGGKVTTSKNDRLQIEFPFKFEEGEYEGQTKIDYQGIETEQNLTFLARRLTQLGYNMPDSLEDITEILEDIANTTPLCRIRIKTNGDFQNVYLDKVFDADDEPDEDTDEESEDEDADETEEEEEEEEEEEKKPKAKKGRKPAAEDEEEEEEEETEEEEEEEEEEAEEEESTELEVGMAVVAQTKDGDQAGEIIELLEDEGKARIKLETGKVIRLSADKLAVAVPSEPKSKGKAKKGKK